MGLIIPSMLALLAFWRASAAGEQKVVVSNPALCQTSDSAKDAIGSCSDGVLADQPAQQSSSRKGARSLLQNQRSTFLASETPRYGTVDIGFCDEAKIGNQLTGDDLATEEDCAKKCQEEKLCAFFSFASKRCRLFEKCTSLKGGKPWTTYKMQKAAPECRPWCAKKLELWPVKCSWPECSGCELGCGELPAEVTRKRGYGHRPGEEFSQCNDTVALGLEDSWYYNWSPLDSPKWECHHKGERIGAEFVPQVLNCGQSAKTIWNNIESYGDKWKRLGVKFLLGYNEPDGHIHPCTPAEGAETWLTVQKIANYFTPPLRLVSPAPTGKDFVLGSSKWLNEFFEKCEALDGCKPDDIEIIAFHDYEGDFDVREDNLKARIEGAAAKYKRKLWLTEFNVGCSKTSLCRDCKNTIYRNGACGWPKDADHSISLEEHLAMMKKAIPFFEKNEHIFRYTWFGARVKPNSFAGYSQLLPYDSTDQTLTELGEYYRDAEG